MTALVRKPWLLMPRRGAAPPSLDLSFMTPGTLDPRITFTRASGVATYFNSAGVMQTVANNVPRWDYNPNTRALNGLLVEEARTNYAIQSAAMGSVPWTPIGVTISTLMAPDGTSTATLLAETATTAPHYITSTVAGIAVNQQITASVFLSPTVRRFARLFIYDNTTPTNTVLVDVDLTLGVINATTLGGAAVAASSTLTAIGVGWFRVTVTATLSATATTGALFRVFMASSPGVTTYPGDTSVTLGAWGAQLESGSYATSYIPTTAATVTRAADVCSTPAAAWFSITAGTLDSEFILNNVGTASISASMASLDDGTINTLYGLRSVSTPTLNGLAFSSATVQAQLTSSNITAGAIVKGALAYSPTTFALGCNGAAYGPIALAVPLAGLTRLAVGLGRNSPINGWTRRVRYWPRALSVAELRLVTT